MVRLSLACVLLTLSMGSKSWASITFSSFQSCSQTNSTIATCSASMTFAAGDFVVLYASEDSTGHTYTVSDSCGQAWTHQSAASFSYTQTPVQIDAWTVSYASAATCSITVTRSSPAIQFEWAAANYSNSSGMTVLGAMSSAGSALSRTCSVSLTTQDDNNFVVAGFVSRATQTSVTASPGTLRGFITNVGTVALTDNSAPSPSSVTNTVTWNVNAVCARGAIELRSCGPPTYCSRSDLNAAEPGATLPNVGGCTRTSNTVTDDLGNGLRILRISDCNFNPAKLYKPIVIGGGGSSDTNQFSQSYVRSGHTHYLLSPEDNGTGTYVTDLDYSAWSSSRIYVSAFHSTGGLTLPNGGCDWAYTSFKTYCNPSNLLQSVDLTDWVSGGQSTPPSVVNEFDYTETTSGLPDFGNNKCLASGFTGQTWNADGTHSKDDQTFCSAFSWYPDWSASTPYPAGTLIHPTALISGTLVSGSFSAGDAAKQATTNATCTVGAVNNTSTTFSCRYFTGPNPPDGTHQWTDTTSTATFNPSGVPTGNAGDWIYYSSGGTSTSGAEPLWGTAQTSGSTVGSDGSITLWTAIQSGQGQGTGNAIACYRVGQGCTTLNTTTGAVSGDWGSTGTITQTDRTLIHNVKVSKDGNWLILQTTLCGLVNSLATCNASASPEVWQIGTTNMPPLATSGEHGGGHWTEGYTHWINGSSFPNPPGFGGYTIRPFSTGSSYRDIYTAAQMPAATGPWDGHYGYSNADVNDTVPFVGSLYEATGATPVYSMGQVSCSGTTSCTLVSGHVFSSSWAGSIDIGGSTYTISGTPTSTTLSLTTNGPAATSVFSFPPITVAWPREIQAIDPTNGTTYRFSHTFVSGEDAYIFNADFAIGSVSQDGKLWAGTSDWLGTLGSTSGASTCITTTNCRSDVFIFELK